MIGIALKVKERWINMVQIAMDMPQGCKECRFRTEYDYCSAMKPNFCGNTESSGKPFWCPLKEDEVTGSWYQQFGMKTMTCSVCKNWGRKTFKYCPHCGAKMMPRDWLDRIV